MIAPVGYQHYKLLIEAAADKHALDPVLVAAVCWQESAFNADAFRFEPTFYNRYLKNNSKYRGINPRRWASSYGLMQLLAVRLFEDKVSENDTWDPEFLFVPRFNLDIGCALLAELLAWAKTKTTDPEKALLATLAAYNGGRGGNDPSKNWPPRNGHYAHEVLAKYDTLRH